MNPVFLSVIVPAYNEESRITPSLTKIAEYLRKKKHRFEIIVVDDGSTDSTVETVNRLSSTIPEMILIKNQQNEGKGSTVKNGVLHANGKIIFFTDADLSTPIEEIDRFLFELKSVDIVIGSRSIKGANVMIHEPFHREILGKIFNRLVRMICVSGFIDTQCGAKMFTNESAKMIFPKTKISRFAFDVEVLYLAGLYHFKVKELPIQWYYSPKTSVRTFLDGPKMLLDVLKIRLLHWNNK